MARYSHKGHDTIRYGIHNYIRYDPRVLHRTYEPQASRQQRTTLEHRRSAYQHCRRCRCLDTGRPARRRSWATGEATVGGGRCSLKSRVIQQGYCEYWLPNNSSCGDSPQLLLFGSRTARRFDGRSAARLKYLVIARSADH